MAANPITTYLQSIETAVAAGTATEHTHRPALKTLLQALVSGITATNEPKHLPCGAPDYVITRAVGGNQLTVGYVEAKDTGKLHPGIAHRLMIPVAVGGLHNYRIRPFRHHRIANDR